MEETNPSNTLALGEPHPAAYEARTWIMSHSVSQLMLWQGALSSCALANNRLAAICSHTLHRLLTGMPVSDRYVLGLAWSLRDLHETDEARDAGESIPKGDNCKQLDRFNKRLEGHTPTTPEPTYKRTKPRKTPHIETGEKNNPTKVFLDNYAVQQAFWTAYPEFTKYRKEGKRHNAYPFPVRKAFDAFVARLVEAGQLHAEFEKLATL